MRLHVLGCGDAFGSGGRHQSAYLFEASDRLFLLDCGPTALLAMKRAGFAPRDLDAIILSHLHGDHFGGLPFFMIEYLYQQKRRSGEALQLSDFASRRDGNRKRDRNLSVPGAAPN
jgi:ribonuclease BN (tRNA processing enzyme)